MTQSAHRDKNFLSAQFLMSFYSSRLNAEGELELLTPKSKVHHYADWTMLMLVTGQAEIIWERHLPPQGGYNFGLLDVEEKNYNSISNLYLMVINEQRL